MAAAAPAAAGLSRDELILSGIPQVELLAKRMWFHIGRAMEYEDLRQYGMIGLIKSADSFEPTRGLKFCTFAEYRIRGAILDGIRAESKCRGRKRRSIDLVRLEEFIGDDGEPINEDANRLLADRSERHDESLMRDDESRKQRQMLHEAVANMRSRSLRHAAVLRGILDGQSGAELALDLHIGRANLSYLRATGTKNIRRQLAARAL